jgi:triosephosphate isomerase
MRKNIVAGNWKMNKSLQEGLALATELKDALAGQVLNCDVVVGTPFIHIAGVVSAVAGSQIGVAAQNCANKESGAYTGEVSASMIQSTGAGYIILGHSERREYYGETSALLNEKVALTLANGLTPIYCCGEALEVRNANEQNAYVKNQLEETVFNLSADDFKKIVIAYEPIWAIGTGVTASTEQAQDMLAFIRSLIADKFDAEIAESTSILYGGSCNAKNAAELFSQKDIDGGLIGGASLKVADFKAIIDAF